MTFKPRRNPINAKQKNLELGITRIFNAPPGLVFVYKEISPPHRLVMTHAWLQEDGSTSPETLVTVTPREPAPGKTEMLFHQGPFDSPRSRDGHEGGWSTSFDKLEAHLASVATD